MTGNRCKGMPKTPAWYIDYAMLMRSNKAETAVHGCLSRATHIVSSFSWDLLYNGPKRKQKQCLCKILGVC